MFLVRIIQALVLAILVFSPSCNKGSSNSASTNPGIVQYPELSQEFLDHGLPQTYVNMYNFSGNYPPKWPTSIRLPADAMVFDPSGNIVVSQPGNSGLQIKSLYVAGITQQFSNKEQLADWFKDQLKKDFQIQEPISHEQKRLIATPNYSHGISSITMIFLNHVEFENWIPFRVRVDFN